MTNLQSLPDPKTIDAIIFDFGGVLFDIDYYAPVREFKKLGFDDFESFYSKKNQAELFDDMEVGKAHEDEFLEQLRPLVLEGVSDSQIMDAWDSILLSIPKERAELVHELKNSFRTFILSNTNSFHVASFEKKMDDTIGLAWFKSAFEKVYYSNEIGVKKPVPATYLALCEWNSLSPERTLFIDDSVQHVKGAVTAGLKGYWLDLGKENILTALASWR